MRVTIYRDEYARVDLTLDEDGDLEVATWYREGNAWKMAEVNPTVVGVAHMVAGLLELGVMGIAARDAGRLRPALAISGIPGALDLAGLLARAAEAVLAKAPADGHQMRAIG